MRVLFVIDSLGLGGGAEHSLAELLPGLRSRGIECSIVCIRNRDFGLQKRLTEEGFHLTVLRSRRFVGKGRELRSIVKVTQPDLVHATLSESCLLSRLAVAGEPAKLVNSLVNNAFEFLESRMSLGARMRRKVFFAIDAVSGRAFVDHFHAVSHDVKTAYVRHLHIPPSRISVVYRGRSRKRLGWPSIERRRSVRRRLGIDDRSFVVLNVGRQDVQKGQISLVRAFAALSARRENCMLIIAGREGSASTELAAAVKAVGRPDRVHVLGHRDDVPDLLSAADAFVLPSYHEGIAGVVIEALAMGLPVVPSDLPGIREVLEEGVNALFFKIGDESSLCSALELLFTEPEVRVAMGERNLKLFEQRFELDSSTSRMVELYESVTAGSRAAAASEGSASASSG